MNTPLGMILVVISGICWSAVYVDCIRTGFKQKIYCMPLFALGLNIAWETIYSYYELFGRETISIQGFANAAWVILDAVLVVTYFKYAKNDCKSDIERKCQVPFGALALLMCIGIQVLFIYEFGDQQAEIYSAYLQNIVMSIAYLYMLNRRQSDKGQTMLIAVCKCIGTLAPTLIGVIEQNVFIVATGIVCFILDVIYIVSLKYVKQKSTRISSDKMRFDLQSFQK